MNLSRMSNENMERYIAKHSDLAEVFWNNVNKEAYRQLTIEHFIFKGYNLSNIYWYSRYNGISIATLEIVFKIDRVIARKIVKIIRKWLDTGYTPILNPTWIIK